MTVRISVPWLSIELVIVQLNTETFEKFTILIIIPAWGNLFHFFLIFPMNGAYLSWKAILYTASKYIDQEIIMAWLRLSISILVLFM